MSTTTETVGFRSAAKRTLAAEGPALRDRIAVETAKVETFVGQLTAAQIKDALDAVGARVPAGTKVAELRDAWVDHAVKALPESGRLRELERAVGQQEYALRTMRDAAQGADATAARYVAAVAATTDAMQAARVHASTGDDLAAAAFRQSAYNRLTNHLSEGADMEDAARLVIRTIVADALGAGLGEAAYFGADTRTQQRTSRDILRTLVRALPEAERSALDYI